MDTHARKPRPRRLDPIYSVSAGLILMLAAGIATAAPPAPPTPQAPSVPAAAPPAPAGGTAPAEGTEGPAPFAPLDLPDWVIRDPAAPKDLPWILVVDDPQCPYCTQLHLAIEKAREQADPEISRSVLATLPFPLAFHDQAAHVVMDAFCLEASGKERGWSAASYLDWLIVAPWRSEPGWKSATIEDIEKDGGLFDSRYDAHKVLSSRRRDFQTERARAEAACGADACRGDAECDKLCAAQRSCREACPAEGAAAPPPGPTAGGGSGPAPTREKCLAGCADRFVSARYRQFSKVHSACLLEQGPNSAHARTAAAYAWAVAHKVPGTPTVYVGHPSIGFRLLGDSDDLAGFFGLLRQALGEARSKLPGGGRTR